MPLSPEKIAEIKSACKMVKKRPLKFFYCLEGEDGDPVLLIGKNIGSEVKTLKKSAKKKKFVKGTVARENNKLQFVTETPTANKFEKNLKKFFGAKIGDLKKAEVKAPEAEPEAPEAEGEQAPQEGGAKRAKGDASAGPTPPPPAPPPPPKEIEKWNKLFANHSFESDPGLAKLLKDLGELKKNFDTAKAAYDAVEAMTSVKPTDPPEDALRAFKAMFDAIRKLVPSIPGVSQFMEMYSKALGTIIDKIAELRQAILKHDQAGGMVVHPGSWPGGRPLYNYMSALMAGNGPINVPKDIIAWVKDQYDMLSFVTGEPPPAKRNERLGLDILAADEVDPEKLKQWFFQHREDVKRFVYGDAEL